MKRVKFAGIFGLALLSACGSGNSGSKDSSQNTSNNSAKDEVDSAGCGSSRTPFGGGSGKESDPFLLCSVAHLEAMSNSSSPSYYALTRDLDMTNEKHGYLGTAIMGVFDGRGHAIQNFNVHLEMGQEGGFLFGQLFTTNELIAEIKNLRLENVSISTNSRLGTAALLGSNNGGKITNVHITGSISGTENVGGIVALNFGSIQSSSFDGEIRGKKIIGGIAGTISDYFIKNCHVGGHASGDSSVGGIAGEAEEKAELIENDVTAKVDGNTDIGLIVGVKKPWKNSLISMQ